MVGTCRVRAAYPFHGMAPEGWILWAVLHECGLTERIGCPRGSGTPRTVSCGSPGVRSPDGGTETKDALRGEGEVDPVDAGGNAPGGVEGGAETRDAGGPGVCVVAPEPGQPGELDAFELIA